METMEKSFENKFSQLTVDIQIKGKQTMEIERLEHLIDSVDYNETETDNKHRSDQMGEIQKGSLIVF